MPSPDGTPRARFPGNPVATLMTMGRPAAGCAPFTCTSACSCGSSITRGSGSVASPSARARSPRSTAPIATALGMRSRNAASGTTGISVAEDLFQAPLGRRERFSELPGRLAETEPKMVRQPEVLARHEQDAVLRAQLLHERQPVDAVAIAREADRPRVGRVPRERVSEAPQPGLEHRVVRLEDAARALQQAVWHWRLA